MACRVNITYEGSIYRFLVDHDTWIISPSDESQMIPLGMDRMHDYMETLKRSILLMEEIGATVIEMELD